MMEVARKGIFNPQMFMFDEIMVIFVAVMLTDILLLDFFMPSASHQHTRYLLYLNCWDRQLLLQPQDRYGEWFLVITG